jgi:hypothetical protein
MQSALSIQTNGFLVSLAGSNAGAMLGPGVYVTTTLEKAMHYATGTRQRPNPCKGAVLQLHLDLGKCYHVKSRSDPMITNWQQHGYDSAFAAAGVIGEREEHCIKDAQRIRVTNVILGHTTQAAAIGYTIVRGAQLSLDEELAAKIRREREEQDARLREERAREARRQAHFITVVVRELRGRTVAIRVDPKASVERTKQLIQEKSGLPIYQMVLLHDTGWQLLHGKTLADYNIRHENTLHVIVGGYKRPGYTNSGATQPDLSQLPAR